MIFPLCADGVLTCFESAIDRLVWELHPENRGKVIVYLSPEEYKYERWNEVLREGASAVSVAVDTSSGQFTEVINLTNPFTIAANATRVVYCTARKDSSGTLTRAVEG